MVKRLMDEFLMGVKELQELGVYDKVIEEVYRKETDVLMSEFSSGLVDFLSKFFVHRKVTIERLPEEWKVLLEAHAAEQMRKLFEGPYVLIRPDRYNPSEKELLKEDKPCQSQE